MLDVTRTCLMAGLLVALSTGPIRADVYKYEDAAGNVYFTDTPLKGNRYRLAWHREAKKLANKTRTPTPGASTTGTGAQASLGSLGKYTPTPMSRSLALRRSSYHGLILANARRYGLSPGLLHAVIRAESAYDPAAVSSAGAQGLMQLMPGTAARYGVSDSFDPVENVRGGAAYLRFLLDLFDQDLRLALAGYNAGEGAVMKHGRTIPPYAETQEYVRRVLQYFRDEQPASIALSIR